MKGKEMRVEDTEKEYTSPEIITYSSKEIIELIGPAKACATPV